MHFSIPRTSRRNVMIPTNAQPSFGAIRNHLWLPATINQIRGAVQPTASLHSYDELKIRVTAPMCYLIFSSPDSKGFHEMRYIPKMILSPQRLLQYIKTLHTLLIVADLLLSALPQKNISAFLLSNARLAH